MSNQNKQYGFHDDDYEISESFLKKGNVMIISDIEGYTPNTQITKILDHLKNGNNLIYNGDVLDYTYNGADRNNTPEKLCALTLLYHLVEGMKKGNVKCQIGNRELNKIKLLFDYYGITYIDAPGEADQLCAWLVINQFAWACLSDDTDMFVYGCNRVLRYFSLINHTAVLYDYDNILKELKVQHDVFKEICVLSGTDYMEGVGAGSLNIIKIMQLYKNYSSCKIDMTFCDWLAINSNIQIDRDLLAKIKGIFDITKLDMSGLGAGMGTHEKNNFNNKKIEKGDLYNLLKEDGFLFPSRNLVKI